jgi:hypothetical protein
MVAGASSLSVRLNQNRALEGTMAAGLMELKLAI